MAGRMGSGKEIQAVTLNIKEQRLLEKSMQTLDLEQTYSLKLVELDHREMRVNQRRMKQRIDRIRSHLEPTQISEFQTQEQEGTFKPAYQPITVSGALRIKAATKRLKLQADEERIKAMRSRTAPPQQISEDEDEDEPKVQCSDTTKSSQGYVSSGVFRKRSNSMSGEIPHGPAQATQLKPSATKPVKLLRPSTSAGARTLNRPTMRRPFTAHGYQGRQDAQPCSTRRPSISSTESVQAALQHERQAEIRQELLGIENSYQDELAAQAKAFITKAKVWAAQDRNPAPDREAKTQKVYQVASALSKFQKPRSDRKMSRAGLSGSPAIKTLTPEEEREKQVQDAWKDLNKCRYLRVPDQKIDLSGVNTLVTDHMKLYNALKSRFRKVANTVSFIRKVSAAKKEDAVRKISTSSRKSVEFRKSVSIESTSSTGKSSQNNVLSPVSDLDQVFDA